MTDRELMKQALEALENVRHYDKENLYGLNDDIKALRERLARQEQDSPCSETLRAQGKPYPRTCRKCGLGPCIGKPIKPARQEQDVPETNCGNMEPVAWCVYLPSQQRAEYFEDPDDLWMADMLTNNEDAEVTTLYTAPQPQPKQDRVPGSWGELLLAVGPKRRVTYVCPVCAASLERQE